MPHAYRFYIPAGIPIAETVALPPEEAHHAARVVRVRVGDTVELFDGAGREWDAAIENVAKHSVEVRVTASRRFEPPCTRLALLQAWPNHEKTAETIIRRGVELGVTEFRFFRGSHSERAPKDKDKWSKLAVETCKQCRRSWLPEFHVAKDLAHALEGCGDGILIATTERPPTPLAQCAHCENIALLIGPEGDFSEDELRTALAEGAQPISLGSAILRAEIAATVAMALIQYERGLLGPRPTSSFS